MGPVKQKSAFEHAQHVRIHIILHMRKVSSGRMISIKNINSIQWLCLRTAKSLIRLRECWSYGICDMWSMKSQISLHVCALLLESSLFTENNMLILNVIFCTDEQLMFSADCGLNPKNNLEIYICWDWYTFRGGNAVKIVFFSLLESGSTLNGKKKV